MLISKKNSIVYVIFACCLSSAFLISFFNSSGFYPLSYLIPLLIFIPILQSGGITKDDALIIALLAPLLLIGGSPVTSIIFILTYLVAFTSITNIKFICNQLSMPKLVFFVMIALSILYAITIGENFSSARFFSRLKGYTLEASYFGMTLLGLWFAFGSTPIRIVILAFIIAAQSGLSLLGLLMRSTLYRAGFLLSISAFSSYLLLAQVSEEFYLSNSFFIRFMGITTLRDLTFFEFVFGRGIGASDAVLGVYLQPFGISAYNGSFFFGIFGDFGLLSFILLMKILSQRIPMALALLLLLNFGLASPYTLFLSWAWCVGAANSAELKNEAVGLART